MGNLCLTNANQFNYIDQQYYGSTSMRKPIAYNYDCKTGQFQSDLEFTGANYILKRDPRKVFRKRKIAFHDLPRDHPGIRQRAKSIDTVISFGQACREHAENQIPSQVSQLSPIKKLLNENQTNSRLGLVEFEFENQDGGKNQTFCKDQTFNPDKSLNQNKLSSQNNINSLTFLDCQSELKQGRSESQSLLVKRSKSAEIVQDVEVSDFSDSDEEAENHNRYGFQDVLSSIDWGNYEKQGEICPDQFDDGYFLEIIIGDSGSKKGGSAASFFSLTASSNK